MRIVGLLIVTILIVIGCVGFGVNNIIKQHIALATAQKTPGKVMKSRQTAGMFGMAKPSIQFEYRVAVTQYQGEKYQSMRLAPIPVICSKSWAKSMIREYKRGKDVTVYIEPNRIEKGFLLPLHQFYPYIFVLLGVAVFLLAQWPLRFGGFFEKPSEPISTGQFGWYRLSANMVTARHTKALGWTALIWYVVVIVLYLHYFVGLGPPYEGLSPWVTLVISIAIGLIPGLMWLKAMKMNACFGSPTLTTTEPELDLNKPVIVRVEQPITDRADIRDLRVSLNCYERTGFSSHRVFTTSAIVSEHKTLQGGTVVSGEFTFEVPEKKQKPASPYNRWEYPRIDWCFEITATGLKGGHYRAGFPIETEKQKIKKKRQEEQ